MAVGTRVAGPGKTLRLSSVFGISRDDTIQRDSAAAAVAQEIKYVRKKDWIEMRTRGNAGEDERRNGSYTTILRGFKPP